MFELRLMQDKIKGITENLCQSLNIDVTVLDKNLIRVWGTGNYYDEINNDIPSNSLFAKVISNGDAVVNIMKSENHICRTCSYFETCKEFSNIGYPIKLGKECIGAIGFVAFNKEQREVMLKRSDEYLKILEQAAYMIEKEILNIEIANKLNMEMTEVNEIINSIDKGIIIINHDGKISHINAKAIKILEIDLATKKIINKKIKDVIKNFSIYDTKSKEVMATWETDSKEIKVVYKSNELVFGAKKVSTMINFDGIEDILKMAMYYTNDESINFNNIVGNGERLKRVIEKAKISAQSDFTILLRGDSGTGKELFARSIHNASPRRHEPFVAINCASIPENLIESELFGYEKGAFTGANNQGKIGKFELANNGTLFLDEIGDLPIHLQPKLLRVLQQKEIVRVGGNTPIKINVRIISASHIHLEELVNEKRFREDLFYRLNVIPLCIPPLRERDTDVLICAEYILNKIYKMTGVKKKLSKEVEEQMLLYDWPGNIRELENILEYAATFSLGDEITLDDLPEYFAAHSKSNNKDTISIPDGTLEEITKEVEKQVIKRCIRIYGNSTEAKKIISDNLGIGLTTLYRKMQDLNINL